jgi:BirA family biotin operon repressor/biotin-[acetyl-CoA-carboxylase] ligase
MITWTDALRPRLATERFGRAMRWVETTASTNTDAARWAAEGAAEGSVVGAEHQTEGRGRHGRAWLDDAGRNLTFSVVLRPRLAPERLPLVTLAACVATCEAVDAFVGGLDPGRPSAAVKWPNDVLLSGRKVCGMLLETSFAARTGASEAPRDGHPEAVILGLGLNVNQTTFPEGLAARATSLARVTGQPVPRLPLLARLLLRLERRYDQLTASEGDGAEAVRAAYVRRLAGRGERVTLRPLASAGNDEDAGEAVTGTLLGVTATGALRLSTEDDGERVFHAGDVTVANDPATA